MKILIDNSNLFAGGGIQVAVSFLNDLKKIENQYEYHVIQSSSSAKAIDKKHFPSNFIFYDLDTFSIAEKIKKVKNIEKVVQPNCIFTIFGPSYHKSKCPKIVGFAFGQMIYQDSPFYKKMTFLHRLKYKMIIFLKKKLFVKNSDVLIFETDHAREVFNYLTSNKIQSYTVSNTLNSIFERRNDWQDFKIEKTSLDILCLAANYPHKNLDILPRVIDEMLRLDPSLSFKFYVSLTKEELHFDDKYDDYLHYMGRVELEKLPSLYSQMDILFMPTLLETFSTTYLEAMYMKVPIVASDMEFARDICEDSALYCSPLDATEYAEKKLLLYNSQAIRKDLTEKGSENLKRFGTSMDRTKKYLEIIKQTISNANK